MELDAFEVQLEIEEINKSESFDIMKGKTLPIGTIKKRPNGNFIKTASGWKYHSANGGGSKTTQEGKKEEGSAEKSTQKTPTSKMSENPFKNYDWDKEKAAHKGILAYMQSKLKEGEYLSEVPSDKKIAWREEYEKNNPGYKYVGAGKIGENFSISKMIPSLNPDKANIGTNERMRTSGQLLKKFENKLEDLGKKIKVAGSHLSIEAVRSKDGESGIINIHLNLPNAYWIDANIFVHTDGTMEYHDVHGMNEHTGLRGKLMQLLDKEINGTPGKIVEKPDPKPSAKIQALPSKINIGGTWKKQIEGVDATYELRGAVIVDDYGDKWPDKGTMASGEKLVQHLKKQGVDASVEPGEKGWVFVHVKDIKKGESYSILKGES